MTSPIPQNAYVVASGTSSTKPFITQIFPRAPTPQDIQWQTTQRWFDSTTQIEYFLLNFVSSGGVVTANWVQISGALGVLTLEGNNPVKVFPDPTRNINIVGDGVTIDITGNALTNTLTASVISSNFFWQDVFVNTVMSPDNGYFTNPGVGPLLMTLPAVAAQGTIIEIAGKGVTWEIVIPLGMMVQVFDQPATTTVTSTKPTDTIRIVCSTANIGWTTLSLGGNVIPV